MLPWPDTKELHTILCMCVGGVNESSCEFKLIRTDSEQRESPASSINQLLPTHNQTRIHTPLGSVIGALLSNWMAKLVATVRELSSDQSLLSVKQYAVIHIKKILAHVNHKCQSDVIRF